MEVGKLLFAFLLGLGLGWLKGVDFGYNLHPYEECRNKEGMIPDYIGECVWLLENQESLRD